MNKEKLITTYEEYKKSNGNDMVKGLGRLMAYQGLDYIEKLLENDEIYCEKLEDSIVGIESYVISKEKQITQLTNNWNELENFIIEQEEINNGAMKCGLSSGSEIKEMGIQNDIYDLILDKMKEIKENNNVSGRD